MREKGKSMECSWESDCMRQLLCSSSRIHTVAYRRKLLSKCKRGQAFLIWNDLVLPPLCFFSCLYPSVRFFFLECAQFCIWFSCLDKSACRILEGTKGASHWRGFCPVPRAVAGCPVSHRYIMRGSSCWLCSHLAGITQLQRAVSSWE